MKRYESAIRVITSFFAVLLGLGLKKLIEPDPAFGSETLRWASAFLSVLLFLRFLLGSSNHMWRDYVFVDTNQPLEPGENPDLRRRMIHDFLFLLVFGLLGVIICYADTPSSFLVWNLVLTLLALSWALVRKPDGEWGYWVKINFAQSFSILVVLGLRSAFDLRHGVLPFWPLDLLTPEELVFWMLCLVYLGAFIWDLSEQLKTLEALKPKPAEPREVVPVSAPRPGDTANGQVKAGS
jgi:hypothetical protein